MICIYQSFITLSIQPSIDTTGDYQFPTHRISDQQLQVQTVALLLSRGNFFWGNPVIGMPSRVWEQQYFQVLHAAETVSAPTVSVLPQLVWHLPTLFPRRVYFEETFCEEPCCKDAEIFHTKARVSKAHSGFISFPVFGNHNKPPFAVFAVLHPC